MDIVIDTHISETHHHHQLFVNDSATQFIFKIFNIIIIKNNSNIFLVILLDLLIFRFHLYNCLLFIEIIDMCFKVTYVFRLLCILLDSNWLFYNHNWLHLMYTHIKCSNSLCCFCMQWLFSLRLISFSISIYLSLRAIFRIKFIIYWLLSHSITHMSILALII